MLNMNFSLPLSINLDEQPWLPSPVGGVKRKPLERSAPESGHTTSVVEYVKGASFATHSHPIGEEILVLEGVFSDEYGDYHAGTYLRNAPGSHHSPFSTQGCKLFVKLNQFCPDDHQEIRTNITPSSDDTAPRLLHQFEQQSTSVIFGRDSIPTLINSPDQKVEILIIAGHLRIDDETYTGLHWLRFPQLTAQLTPLSETTYALLKVG